MITNEVYMEIEVLRKHGFSLRRIAVLANVVLDELDWELERRGHRFARYAVLVPGKSCRSRSTAMKRALVSMGL